MGADRKMSMRLFIGGVRGSLPCTGGAFEEFGGDTTSLLVLSSNGEYLVLDAGTGLRAVARQLAQQSPGKVTILFSHYHLDHLAGLMMNPLFYDSDWSFNLIGPTFADGGVRDAVTRLLAPPYWPVSWKQIKADLEFAVFDTDQIQIGPLRVRGCPIPHPGGCLSYRIDDTDCGASFVYATDIEWAQRTIEHEKTFMKICREPEPADILLIDAHFAKENEKSFAGWGHTSWQDCLDIAQSAGIENLLLGHHAPEANDETLRALESQVKKRMPDASLARTGQWITIAD